MKLCVFLILATATSVIADGHADICSSQFNWWYGVSNNQGPAGYPDETAEEKLHRLVKKALPDGTPIPSMCEMQKNANGYYHHWEEILREINNMPPDAPAPGFGFPFQSRTGKSYDGLTPTCVKEDSIAGRFITFDDVQNNAGGPAASCAFGYPGLGAGKHTVTVETPDGSTNVTLFAEAFDNVKSTCRLKILGFEDEDLELQWCITNILETMRVDKEGGYYDGHGSTTPDINCSIQTTFQDANPISGNAINPPYVDSPYPTTFLGPTPLGPNPGGDPVTWNCFDNLQKNITTVQDCFDKFENNKNTTALEKCLKKGAGFNTVKNDPNDPYQSFPILFRQFADQKVAGMCSACEECRIAVRHDGYPDPEGYCQTVGKCGGTPSPPLPPMPPPPKKSSKKK